MFNTDDFSYKNRTFSAFASDFSKHKFDLMFPQDLGVVNFVLVSSRTGNRIRMRLQTTHRDRENDLTHWTFIPIDDADFDNLIVFND